MTEQEIILKGGSLNKTALVKRADGTRIIRKSISLTVEREYGFVRWYSQMKRIQRYNRLFPGLFPLLLDTGTEGDTAFFEIEYIEGSFDLKRYLVDQDPDEKAVSKMHEALWTAMNQVHASPLTSNPSATGLYFKEEVERKVLDALKDSDFKTFAEQEMLFFHGQVCAPLIRNLDQYRQAFEKSLVKQECFTHGNITLENVVYAPSENRIVFIDPYDENIIDCRENEYSQVLQCSKDLYGYINDRTVRIDGNRATSNEPEPKHLRQFDQLFRARLEERLTENELNLVRLFEISQFARMLPFKVAAGDIDKAKYFYALASKLLDDYLSD